VDAQSRLRFYCQRLDEFHARLLRLFPTGLNVYVSRVSELETAVERSFRHYLQGARQRLDKRSAQLDAYSPLAVLQRGYAIVTKADHVVVRGPDQVSPGEILGVRVARGEFKARKEPTDGI